MVQENAQQNTDEIRICTLGKYGDGQRGILRKQNTAQKEPKQKQATRENDGKKPQGGKSKGKKQ